MKSDGVAAHLSAIKYSVEHRMTPKQTFEKMRLAQQNSSVNRGSCINDIEDFQRDRKGVALKKA